MTYGELRSFLKALRYDFRMRASMTKEEIKILRRGLPGANFCCTSHTSANFVNSRAESMRLVLQQLLDIDVCWNNPKLRSFLSVSSSSFNPSFGPKGLEMWASKASGGYHAGHSSRYGDYITLNVWRWFVFYPNQIQWYQSEHNPVMKGVFHVNSDFKILLIRPYVLISNGTRTLRIKGVNKWETTQMYTTLVRYYKASTNAQLQSFQSSYPVRSLADCRIYTYSKDYFEAAALAMLGAKTEICIASWKQSPRVLLTRPPSPPLRLDQVLAFKAQQGVKIYILLYKEVELSGQGNDSAHAMAYLSSLHANIHVLRHPNKLVGGSTAVMWSHHEKLVCVDRNIAFVGGIDLAIGRWDDESHDMVDPFGLKYPGEDYRQPAERMHIPVVQSAALARKTLSEAGAISGLIAGTKNVISGTFGKAASAFGKASGTKSGGEAAGGSPRNIVQSSSEIDQFFSYEYMSSIEDEDGGGFIDNFEQPNPQQLSISLRASNAKADTSLSPEHLKKFQCRDLYPRTGWHDVQCCVSGVAARDVAAHFSERWNHHRLSLKEYEAPLLPFFTCETQWGLCARCFLPGIFELAEHCPRCNNHLGSASPALQAATDSHLPLRLNTAGLTCPAATCAVGDQHFAQSDSYNFIEFEMQYHLSGSEASYDRLILGGDCPAVVLGLRSNADIDAKTKQPSGIAETARCESASSNTVEVDSSGVSAVPSIAVLPDPRGKLLRRYGNHSKTSRLVSLGLSPQVGDIISTVDGRTVSHVSSSQLQRYISVCKAQKMLDIQSRDSIDSSVRPLAMISFLFRRHYSEGIHHAYTPVSVASPVPTDAAHASSSAFQTEETSSGTSEESSNFLNDSANPIHSAVSSPERYAASPLPASAVDASLSAAKKDWPYDAKEVGYLQAAGNALFGIQGGHLSSVRAAQIMNVACCRAAASSEISYNASLLYHNSAAAAGVDVGAGMVERESREHQPAAIPALRRTDGGNDADVDVVRCNVPVARVIGMELCAQTEVQTGKQVLEVTATADHADFKCSYNLAEPILPKSVSDQGTCCVQVLRSSGKWSLGKASTECSIANAWCDAIAQAKHFIYIENQFFIGSAGLVPGQVASNNIPEALLRRMVAAAQKRENFRAIVIIPQHPQGDIAFASRPQIILHYQRETIHKGPHSIISRFKALCPGVNPFQYIGFFCLHNFGVLNHKFVHDQVYVHDKLLCVDDRVLIIGSANINDRSMLGDRDSEVAVRIEDTHHMAIQMAGAKFSVGSLPHRVRCKLMRQHLGVHPGAHRGASNDEKTWNPNVEDPVSPEVYEYTWQIIADNNATHYSKIDGARDVYSPDNERLNHYRNALQNYDNPHVLDAKVLRATDAQNGGIRGTLVPWPMQFLAAEDLSPSLASGMALVPKSLWV
jgi:phosphatidylserine/phosphatidylglycerophosphate/cardiolipin synthase-like enzyme